MVVEIALRAGLYYNCNKNTSVVFMTNETEVTTMKKSSYFALVMGMVSGVMFALGMCMALVEEWAMLKGGVILGGAGLLLGLVTLLIWRRMTHKEPVRVSGKLVAQILLGVLAALVLGIGLSLCLVMENYILGTAIGLVGILMLLGFIPLVKGLK